MKIKGYYGTKNEHPLRFVPKGICLKIPLCKENEFNIEQDIDVDELYISIYLHYDKKGVGCGTIAGWRFQNGCAEPPQPGVSC